MQIGDMECKNRILRSASWEALSDEEGFMSERQYEIYEELAKNEISLISTGYARVMEEDCPNAGMMGIYDDKFIPSYQRLTDCVHHHGGKIMMQIAYGALKLHMRWEKDRFLHLQTFRKEVPEHRDMQWISRRFKLWSKPMHRQCGESKRVGLMQCRFTRVMGVC
nr:hypothetical protein [uncultured Blautia sp.]